LTAVLKAHLWVEASLIGLIEVSLAKPGVLDLDRMTFAQKLRLAEASGGLQPEVVPWVRALNKLRNNLAHELDGDASDEALEELARFADKRLDLAVLVPSAVPDSTSAQARFRIWVAVYLLALEWHRMRLEWRKAHQEAIQKYELQLALLAMAGTEVTEERRDELRQTWGLPPEPSYRDVFMNGEGSSLFGAV
jgi:hypothetical protein